MNAVLAWARIDLRRRWRSLLVLVLLIALSGGVVLAAAAGARRTHTAIPRLLGDTETADAMVLANQPNFDWSKVAKLPSVERLGRFVLTFPGPKGANGFVNDESVAGFAAGDLNQNRTIDGPAILSGRAADPMNPNEILVSPGFIAKYGRTISLQFPTKLQAAEIPFGGTYPAGMKLAGPVVTLHVVGVAVNTFDLGPGGGPVYEPTYAFFTRYIKPIFPYFENARVILKGGEAAIPEFRKELAAATGNPNIEVADWRQNLADVQRTANFTAVGWLLFGGAALIASLLLIGQAFVRFSVAGSEDLRTLSAVGLDRRQEWWAAACGPVVAAALGCVLSVGLAIGLSRWFPTGLVREFEPTPGTQVDWTVLPIGAAVLLVLSAGGALLAGRLAVSRAAEPAPRVSIVATAARRLGLGVVPVLGTRLALESGRGRDRVPVRPALTGAVAGVLGIVGALTFQSALSSTVNNPVRFGQTFAEIGLVNVDGGPSPAEEQAIHEVAADDPDIAVLNDTRVEPLDINGRGTTVFSLDALKGTTQIVTLSGRPPSAANEISLGPTTMKSLHVHVGSAVTVDGHSFVVSGETYVPEDAHNDYTDGAWMTASAFDAVDPNLSKDKFHEVRFNFRPGVNTATALKRLASYPKFAPGGIEPATAGDYQIHQQIELHSIKVQPLLLGGFLILLAMGAVGHGLASAVRRRRHDLAVLRSLGMTRWQTRLTVATQATVIAVVGLLFGIPLGIAAGRTGWRVLADTLPFLYVAPLALLVLLVAVPATIAASNLLAALPARRAVRMRVSEVLRAE